MSLSRNALFAALQVVATGMVLFALYYYVVRTLGPEGIGLWSLILAGASTSRLADFGFGAGVTKHVAQYVAAARLTEANNILLVGFVCAVCVTGLFVLGLWLLSDYFLAFALQDVDIRQVAVTIVPVALYSVWAAGAAAVLLSALDGLQRLDLRVIVVVSSSLLQLVATWILVPRLGVRGLAMAHLVQSATTLLIAAVILRIKLGRFERSVRTLDVVHLKSLLRYGAGIQTASVAQMTIDPVARMLLARFGTLELTGFYEMTARLVIQARSLLVAGYQALIPHVATLADTRRDAEIRGLYLHSYDLLVVVGIPYFGILLAALPAISQLWLGSLHPTFLLMGSIAVVAWAANALIVPAYYVFLGTGQLRWNVASQVVTAIATALFGLLLGLQYGGIGVALGCCFALIIGSAVVLIGFHRRASIPGSRALRPLRPISLLAWLGGLCIVLVAPLASGPHGALIAFVGPILLTALVGFVLLRWEPRVQRALAQLAAGART